MKPSVKNMGIEAITDDILLWKTWKWMMKTWKKLAVSLEKDRERINDCCWTATGRTQQYDITVWLTIYHNSAKVVIVMVWLWRSLQLPALCGIFRRKNKSRLLAASGKNFTAEAISSLSFRLKPVFFQHNWWGVPVMAGQQKNAGLIGRFAGTVDQLFKNRPS